MWEGCKVGFGVGWAGKSVGFPLRCVPYAAVQLSVFGLFPCEANFEHAGR